MLLEDVAAQCIVNAKITKDKSTAIAALKTQFALQYPFRTYESWNREIPDGLFKNIVSNVGKNGSVSIKFLIDDLEAVAKAL